MIHMNNMFIILDSNTTKHSRRELSKTLASVLPGRIAVDFIKQGGNKLTTEVEIKTLINTLEEADAVKNRIRNSGDKKNNFNKDKNHRNNTQRERKESQPKKNNNDKKITSKEQKHVQISRTRET